MHQTPRDLTHIFLTILTTIPSILTPSHSLPLADYPGGLHQSTLLSKLCRRRTMTVPDINALTDLEEMILVHKNTIVQLTKRSTKINLSSMKAMRSIWKWNMTSPMYRRTISPHEVIFNSTMSAKEHTDLQFMRWREVFLMKPEELTYYVALRKKFHQNYHRQCPACRQDVLDTYEQYMWHSFEYDERGYVPAVTPPYSVRYPHNCYLCMEEFESMEQYARHLITHSVQFKGNHTWTYPYTEAPTVAGRKTSIVNLFDQDIYFNVFPGQDESTEFPKWIRTPNPG